MEKGWKLIRKGGKLEMEAGKRSKKRWWPFFFFFFFFFLLFTFENDENLFWVYHNGNFLPGKPFNAGKKIRKNDFAPSEKYACYAPAFFSIFRFRYSEWSEFCKMHNRFGIRQKENDVIMNVNLYGAVSFWMHLYYALKYTCTFDTTACLFVENFSCRTSSWSTIWKLDIYGK